MKRFAARCRESLSHADTWVFASATLFLLLYALAEALIHTEAAHRPKSAMLRVMLLVLICTQFYLGGLLHQRRTQSPRTLRLLWWFFFVMYLYLLFNMTLWDKGMGRNDLLADATGSRREYYLDTFVNLRPGRSIYTVYISGFLNGYVNAYYTLLNLLGNVCAFMPFAFFLPLFFKAQRRWFVFIPTVTLTVALVETLQFVFMVGSCDVDDLILNTSGAILLFFLLRIPPLCRLLSLFVRGRRSASAT